MKLGHAINVVEKKLEGKSVSPADETIALRVLMRMGKRILDTRQSLRAVVRAVYGEDLNQTELDELFKQE